jgi:hypothetical protein
MAAGIKTGGRTKGTPNKATADIKAVAQVYTEEAVNALAVIMRTSESDAAKVAAIKELLDRGHGKPTQSVDLDANVKATVQKIERAIVDSPNRDS